MGAATGPAFNIGSLAVAYVIPEVGVGQVVAVL
jgi:hypothetical protein